MGALFVLVLGAAFAWYFLKRRKSNQTALRISDPSRPQSLPPNAQPELRIFTEGRLSSHFNGPPDTRSQGLYKPPQASLTVPLPQSTTSHTATNALAVMGSNLSEASLTGITVMGPPSPSLLSSTIPPNSSATTPFSSMPPISEAHRSSRVSYSHIPPVGLPPYSLRDPTTGGAPPRSRAQIPDEPLEEGLMSWRASMVTTLPHYSPGGLLHDDRALALPERSTLDLYLHLSHAVSSDGILCCAAHWKRVL